MWPQNNNFNNGQNWAFLAQQWAAQQFANNYFNQQDNALNFEQYFPQFPPPPLPQNYIDNRFTSMETMSDQSKPSWRESHQNKFIARQPLRPYYAENSFNNEFEFNNSEFQFPSQNLLSEPNTNSFYADSSNPVAPNPLIFPLKPKADLSFMKKKAIPPWLRDAIEKMEKDKLKKDTTRDIDELSQNEPFSNIINYEINNDKLQFENNIDLAFKSDTPLADENQIDDGNEYKVIKEENLPKKEHVDIVAEIKILLTEILMLSTQQIIEEVVDDRLNIIKKQIADKDHQKSQKALRKISDLGIGEYGSEDDNEEEADDNSDKKEASFVDSFSNIDDFINKPETKLLPTSMQKSSTIDVSITTPKCTIIEGNSSKLSKDIQIFTDDDKTFLPSLDINEKSRLDSTNLLDLINLPPEPIQRQDSDVQNNVKPSIQSKPLRHEHSKSKDSSSRTFNGTSLLSEVAKTVLQKTTTSKKSTTKLDAAHQGKQGSENSKAKNHHVMPAEKDKDRNLEKHHHHHHRHHHHNCPQKTTPTSKHCKDDSRPSLTIKDSDRKNEKVKMGQPATKSIIADKNVSKHDMSRKHEIKDKVNSTVSENKGIVKGKEKEGDVVIKEAENKKRKKKVLETRSGDLKVRKVEIVGGSDRKRKSSKANKRTKHDKKDKSGGHKLSTRDKKIKKSGSSKKVKKGKKKVKESSSSSSSTSTDNSNNSD